jgi:hypothetical protein
MVFKDEGDEEFRRALLGEENEPEEKGTSSNPSQTHIDSEISHNN